MLQPLARGLGMTTSWPARSSAAVGSPVADVSAMGSGMIPMMKKEGYDVDYAVNVTTHASLSVRRRRRAQHDHLLAGGGSGVSIGALILAGVVPTIVLAVCMMIAAYWVAVRRNYPRGTWHGWGAVARSGLSRAARGLFVAVIIIVGILSGVFTATESAAIAVLYAVLITFVGYRTMTRENFLKASAKAVKTTGVVLLLIGVSATFQYLIGLYQVAHLTGQWMAAVSTEPWVVFLLINLILFVLGTFMDMASTILICTPIFLPIAAQYGMDPVQFGIVMLVNCALGLNTPPVGNHAVRRLRDRWHLGRAGDAHHSPVLRRAHRRAARRDLRPRRSRSGFRGWPGTCNESGLPARGPSPGSTVAGSSHPPAGADDEREITCTGTPPVLLGSMHDDDGQRRQGGPHRQHVERACQADLAGHDVASR